MPVPEPQPQANTTVRPSVSLAVAEAAEGPLATVTAMKTAAAEAEAATEAVAVAVATAAGAAEEVAATSTVMAIEEIEEDLVTKIDPTAVSEMTTARVASIATPPETIAMVVAVRSAVVEAEEDITTSARRPQQLVDPVDMAMLLLLAKRRMAEADHTRTVVMINVTLARHLADPTRTETVLRCLRCSGLATILDPPLMYSYTLLAARFNSALHHSSGI